MEQASSPSLLANGSAVTFAGESFGKPLARCPSGGPLFAICDRLPASISRLLHIYPVMTIAGVNTNSLVLWFWVSRNGLGSSAAFFSELTKMEPNSFFPGSPAFAPRSRNRFERLVQLPVFPRRSKDFKIRVYNQDAQGRLSLAGEMSVPNPAYRTYTEWRPEAAPGHAHKRWPDRHSLGLSKRNGGQATKHRHAVFIRFPAHERQP